MTYPQKIGILAALPQEISWAIKEMEIWRRSELPGGWMSEGRLWGREVAVAITGMGKRSEEAVDSLARVCSLHSLLSCGFGGGTAENLKKGEAVICQGIVQPEKGELFSNERLCLQAAQALAQAGIPFSYGRGLTVSRFISDPQEKMTLAKRYGVQVVDMESFWEAKVAASWGIPFLAVRFISDTLTEQLPRFEQFIGVQGDWQIGRATSYFISHPLEILAVPGFLLGSWKAKWSLSRFLKFYLEGFDESK